ncbi:MAG: DUF99 family protein [Candidatus Micrarchaeaceae archaeon]
MKRGARYIAIASGPKGRDSRTILIGVIFRDGYIEGVLSGSVAVDGTDSTAMIIRMIEKSRFREQIRILVLNGIAIAGLNITDPKSLERKLGTKVVLLNRKKQNPKELINALRKFSISSGKNADRRIAIVSDYGKITPIKMSGVFVQCSLEPHYARKFAERAFEALRVAHMIARGISTGESKGRL